MKKIMFNDKYGLTQAVLEGRKTQTRRLIKTSDAFERVNPDYDWDEEDIKNWNNDFALRIQNMPEEEKKNCFDYLINHPKYKVGEVVAVAQSYKDADICFIQCDLRPKHSHIWGHTPNMKGWNNKMFVQAECMPHQIRITNVRAQRLQDISDEDCLKEGAEWDAKAKRYYVGYNRTTNKRTWLQGETPREAYAALIDKISGKGTWEKNPYVWVYDFELVK